MDIPVDQYEQSPQPEPRGVSKLGATLTCTGIVLASAIGISWGNEASHERTYCVTAHASEVSGAIDATRLLHDRLNEELDEVQYWHFSVNSVAKALNKAQVNPARGAEVCGVVHDNIIGRMKDRLFHTRHVVAHPDPDPQFFP